MTIYFQHVGERGGQRDFPKTIGTQSTGLVKLHWGPLSEAESKKLERQVAGSASQGFQVWGIPTGAKSVLRNLSVGDYLLLLESATVGGGFVYAGRVIGVPRSECWELSQHLWGEQKFPLIMFLTGGLTHLSYQAFCEAFGYNTKWNPAGQTYRLQPERIQSSSYGTEEQFIHALIGFIPDEGPERAIADFTLMDMAELDTSDEEGRLLLRLHIQRERSARLVAEFKRSLAESVCCVCGFDFGRFYVALGEGFIEAHHTIPIAQMDEGQETSIRDLVPVCSNCHQMLHRRSPAPDWRDLKRIIGETYDALEGRQ